MDIYEEIKAERAAQDAKWGGPEHDDCHSSIDWLDFITTHHAKAFGWRVETLYEGHWHTVRIVSGSLDGMPDYRRQMVRVAALAVAAIESFDRLSANLDAVTSPTPQSAIFSTQGQS